jgi:DNA polymerase/3'-5' exonuclease PolX
MEKRMDSMPGPPVTNSGFAARRPSVLSATAEHGYDFLAQDAQIADKLYQAADILAAQGAAPFRVAAYRRAANSISARDDDLGTITAQGGRKALEAIPSVGASIAGAIGEMLATGRWTFLEHLKGTADPETLFRAVPGVGPALARRICRTLQIRATCEKPKSRRKAAFCPLSP